MKQLKYLSILLLVIACAVVFTACSVSPINWKFWEKKSDTVSAKYVTVSPVPISLNTSYSIFLLNGTALFPTGTLSNANLYTDFVLWNGTKFTQVKSPVPISIVSYQITKLDDGKAIFGTINYTDSTSTSMDFVLWDGTKFTQIKSPVPINVYVTHGFSVGNGKALFDTTYMYNTDFVLWDGTQFVSVKSPTSIGNATPSILGNGKALFYKACGGGGQSDTVLLWTGTEFEQFTAPAVINANSQLVTNLGNGQILFSTNITAVGTAQLTTSWILWNGIEFIQITSPVGIDDTSGIVLGDGKALFSTTLSTSTLLTNWVVWSGTEFVQITSPVGINNGKSNAFRLGNGKALFVTVTTTSSTSQNWVLWNGNQFVQVYSPVAISTYAGYYNSNSTLMSYQIGNGDGKMLFSVSYSANLNISWVLWNGTQFVQVSSPGSIYNISMLFLGFGKIMFYTYTDSVSTNFVLWDGTQFEYGAA